MPDEKVLDETGQRQIVDYVMTDLSNRLERLELAVGVYSAFEKIREAVIRIFVSELSQRLESTLDRAKGWKVDAVTLLNEPSGKGHIAIRNDAWMNGLSVMLDAEAYGPRSWWLGVETPAVCSFSDAITTHLSKKLGEATNDAPQNPYPWWRRFEGKWKDWRLEDWRYPQAVLALGEGGGGSYGNYLHQSLVAIATTLDQVARGKS